MIRSIQCNHSQSYQLGVKIHQIAHPPPPPPLQVAIWWLGNGSMDYIYQNANFLLAVLNEKEKPKFSRVGELNPSTQ